LDRIRTADLYIITKFSSSHWMDFRRAARFSSTGFRHCQDIYECTVRSRAFLRSLFFAREYLPKFINIY